MLISESAEVSWNPKNIKWYESKGHIFTKFGDIFLVKLEDLTTGSRALVKVECDNLSCTNIWEVKYVDYLTQKKRAKNKNDCCLKCRSFKLKPKTEPKKIKLFSIIQKAFVERDYILLTTLDEYRNNTSKLKYLCKHHLDKGTLEITWNDISQGHGCRYCGIESSRNTRLFDFDFISNEFSKLNYILIEDKYINNKTPMRYICIIHPNEIQTTTYKQVHRGGACKYCALNKNKGRNHYNWKGGVSTLYIFFRQKIIDWKRDSIRNCDYKCVITGGRFYAVHHLYSFNKIIEEVFKETDLPIHNTINNYTDNELKLLEDKCLEIHYRYPLGVCLANEVHYKFHSIYGNTHNTPEQFEEFKLKHCNQFIN